MSRWARCAAWIALAMSGRALAADPFTAETLAPLLHNEVNALQLNHLLLQSQFALDGVPFTIGSGVRGAPARYLRSDGQVTEAGLAKVLYALSWGTGRPSSGTAVFAGALVSQVRTSGFPNILALSGDEVEGIGAQGGSAVVYAGLARRGWAAQVALYPTGLSYDADDAGRFQPGGCGGTACTPSRDVRPGSPVPGTPDHTVRKDTRWLLNFEQQSGYSVGGLVGRVRRVDDLGRESERTALAALRLLAQPHDLVSRSIGVFGTGLNNYAPEVDYYGDQVARAFAASEVGAPPPATPERGIWEIPLIGDNVAESGVSGRVVVQALPVPLFRLAEVGYAIEREPWSGRVVQAGARFKVFRRAQAYAPSADAYGGIYWMFRGERAEGKPPRGLSTYVSYSYNSPDSLTFVALPDAHVLGLQLVYGNPMALPPPVSILKYPASDADPGASDGGGE